jgi:hypothetical protein
MAQAEVTDAATEPPESFAPPKTTVQWIAFAHYPNEWDAHIVAGLLENEGVPAAIETNGVFPGAMGDSTVWVPQPLAHRVRWILALLPPTEAELTFLAVGELPS